MNDCDHKFRQHELAVCKRCAKVFIDGIYSPTVTKLWCGTKEAEGQ